MAKRPRIDRKTLKQPDEFVTKGKSLVDHMVEHRRTLGIVAVVALIFSAVYYGYKAWSEDRLNDSWNQYMEASKTEGDKRWEALAGFYDSAPNLRPRSLAAVALADHYYEAAKKSLMDGKSTKLEGENKAALWYQRALEYGGLVSMERQLLLVNLGQAYELEGKYAEARGSYEQAASLEGEAKGLALLNLGRAWELEGDSAKAKENYQKVVTDFGGTEYAKMAKNYKRAMDSPLIKDIFGK